MLIINVNNTKMSLSILRNLSQFLFLKSRFASFNEVKTKHNGPELKFNDQVSTATLLMKKEASNDSPKSVSTRKIVTNF